MARPAISTRSTNVNWKSGPTQLLTSSSNHAVIVAAPAPTTTNGSRGRTSRFHDNRPRRHQKTTSSAPGSVAVTVLVNSASTNVPNAAAHHPYARLLRPLKFSRPSSNRRYAIAAAR